MFTLSRSTGAVYRWTPGESGFTEYFALDSLNYGGGSSLTQTGLLDMNVDSNRGYFNEYPRFR